MFNRKRMLSSAGRRVVMATIAALACAMAEPPLAVAGQINPGVKQAAVAGGMTDVSAARRHYHHYRHYRGNPAAGLAIMGAMIGTIGAIAAHERDDYYDGPGYYVGPGYYYGPPPVYYAPHPYYYGPRIYRYYPY